MAKGTYFRTKETRLKNRLARLGKKLSEEHKMKISLSGRGKKRTDEQKERYSLARLKWKVPYKDTSIEIKLQEFLKRNNIEFKTQYPIVGRPDVFIQPNICIFADGCYWHGCQECKFINLEANNKDDKTTRKLELKGYVVIRIWEHDIKKNNFSKIQTFYEGVNINNQRESARNNLPTQNDIYSPI